jgi:capsular exopolysaccharide synthesis family protein
MSKFLKALELAEQERAPRHHPAPAEPATERGASVPEPVPSRALRPVVEPLRGVSGGLEEHLVSLLAPTSFEAEQYRALRHMIEQLHKSTDLSIIAVSSPSAADGKTTTAINLAGALAQARDARVLLVDVDLRGAALAPRLGIDDSGGPGLVEAILDADLPLEAVVRVRPPLNLSVLPAGRLPSAPYEVLKSPRVGELLAEARRRYDYIVLDTPPLVSFPDCRVLAKWVDGLLIVVSAHRTARKLLEEALHLTEQAKVVGLIFNGDDHHLSRESYPLGRYADRYSDRNGDGSKRRTFWSRHRTGRRQTASDD